MFVRSFAFCCCLILFRLQLHSQPARYAGCALRGTVSRDEWSVFANPAGLSATTGLFTAFSQVNRYMIVDWNNSALLLAGGGEGRFRWGGGISRAGFAGSNTLELPVTCSVSAGRRSSVGIGICAQLESSRESSKRSVGCTAGTLIGLSERSSVGFTVKDPQELLAHEGSRLRPGTVFSAGYLWQTSASFRCTAELDAGFDGSSFRFGLEYMPAPGVTCRLGYSAEDRQLAGGLGYSKDRYGFDFSLRHHPYLGFSCGAGAAYRLK
jgi:hypothetical protein